MAAFDVLIIEDLLFSLGQALLTLGLLYTVQQPLHEAPRMVRVHAVVPSGGGHQQRRIATCRCQLRVNIVVGGVLLQESPILAQIQKRSAHNK